MHTVYKTLQEEDISKIINLCRRNSVKKGGVFEVYPGEKKETWTVIANSALHKDTNPALIPLGIFYINMAGEGILSIEDEDPKYDGMPSTGQHVKATKKIIDRLLETIQNSREDDQLLKFE